MFAYGGGVATRMGPVLGAALFWIHDVSSTTGMRTLMPPSLRGGRSGFAIVRGTRTRSVEGTVPEPENVAEGVERQRNIFAAVAAGVVGFVLLVFIFQNTDRVEVQWLFLSLRMPLWVLIVLVLVLGATLGWIVRWLMRRRKKD